MNASKNFFQIIKLLNKTPIIMSQNAQPLQIVKQLYHIYPDIEGQLCSRHSTLFGKLRTTFNKLYDNMEPTHYVIVKGTCQFVQQQFTQLKLSMALQNGIIILISKTYPTSQIFVNSNHFDQQIIFSENGQLVQGLNPWSDQMTKVLKDSSCNLLAQQRYGGIMYIHANIPQNSFKYKQTFCMAMYIANLVINDNLKNFNKQQIVDKMSKLGFMGSKQDLQRQFFGYKNRKFNLTLPDLLSVKDKSLSSMNMQSTHKTSTPSNQCQISMQNTQNSKQMDIQYPQENNSKRFSSSKRLSYSQNYRTQIIQKSHLLLDMNKDEKFLFCKLDLAKQDVNYEFCRRKQIQIRKNQLLKQLYESNKISGLFDLFHHQQINISQYQFKSQYQRTFAPKSMEELDYQDDDQILKESNKFLQVLLHEINLISQFSNQNITLEKLIENLWEINSQYLKLHSQQVVQLVQDMKQRLQIKGCMVINQNFLLIVVNKNKFTQLLCQVKEKMNKGQLKSKSLFKIQDQEEMILQRWANDDKGIGQKMFTSVPAQGVGIFDPSQAIWFD